MASLLSLADGSAANVCLYRVKLVAGLMPFVSTCRTSTRQERVRALAQRPRLMATLAGVISWLPVAWRRSVVRSVDPKMDADSVDATVQLLRHSIALVAFTMGKSEFEDLDADDGWRDLEAVCAKGRCAATSPLLARAATLCLLTCQSSICVLHVGGVAAAFTVLRRSFCGKLPGCRAAILGAADDPWWPQEHHERAQDILQPELITFDPDQMHAFCTNPALCDRAAAFVARCCRQLEVAKADSAADTAKNAQAKV